MPRYSILKDMDLQTIKEMYLQPFATYESVAKRLDVCWRTIYRYVKPILTEEEKAAKARENYSNRPSRIKAAPAPVKTEPEHVPTMRERMEEWERKQNRPRPIVPNFGDMQLVCERRSYELTGVARYTVNVTGRSVAITTPDFTEGSCIEATINADDLGRIIRDLQTIQNLFIGGNTNA